MRTDDQRTTLPHRPDGSRYSVPADHPRSLRGAWPLVLASCFAVACNSNDGRHLGNGSGASDLGVSPPDAKKPDLGPTTFNRDMACAMVGGEATLSTKPVDIIIVIDDSGSMSEEMANVQKNINQSFAQIIGASGLDYHVILLTAFGNYDLEICVPKPLGGNLCNGTEDAPINTSNFYFYNADVDSNNSLRVILDTYNKPDFYKLSPNGWSEWLRPDAAKVFLEVTDDESDINAYEFEQGLFKLTPKMFGDAANRNYIFHSIIAIEEKAGMGSQAYLPNEPKVTDICLTGWALSKVYQDLSKLTGGLRFPVCLTDYTDVFKEIAKGVIKGSQLSCQFAVPNPPVGETLDQSTIIIDYTPGGTGAVQTFKQVASAADCGPNSFYVLNSQINLCPDVCNTLKNDMMAKVKVYFDCSGPVS